LSIDEHHVALPKLYGAPAYARPPRRVEDTPRPLDTDDLPIAVLQTEDERKIAETLPGRPYLTVVGEPTHANGSENRRGLQGRPFRLRALAGRLLRGA
jgi:hypothetical protein